MGTFFPVLLAIVIMVLMKVASATLAVSDGVHSGVSHSHSLEWAIRVNRTVNDSYVFTTKLLHAILGVKINRTQKQVMTWVGMDPSELLDVPRFTQALNDYSLTLIHGAVRAITMLLGDRNVLDNEFVLLFKS